MVFVQRKCEALTLVKILMIYITLGKNLIKNHMYSENLTDVNEKPW